MAQLSQHWEQEVQSSKHQRGRQHPIVLILEVKQGPLRTSFPNRACLLQAGPPSARQPPRPNPAAASQWLSVELTQLPVQTRLQTLLRSLDVGRRQHPDVQPSLWPLASKPVGSKSSGSRATAGQSRGGGRAEAGAEPRRGQSRGGAELRRAPLPTSEAWAQGWGWRHQGPRDPDPPRGRRNETGHARQQRDPALHSHTSPKRVTGQSYYSTQREML